MLSLTLQHMLASSTLLHTPMSADPLVHLSVQSYRRRVWGGGLGRGSSRETNGASSTLAECYVHCCLHDSPWEENTGHV